MGDLASWRWYQVGAVWAAGLLLVFTSLMLHIRKLNSGSWYLPFPGSLRGFVGLIRAIWERAPLLAIELVVVALVLLSVTGYWLARR